MAWLFCTGCSPLLLAFLASLRDADKNHHLPLEEQSEASLEGGRMEQRLERGLRRSWFLEQVGWAHIPNLTEWSTQSFPSSPLRTLLDHRHYFSQLGCASRVTLVQEVGSTVLDQRPRTAAVLAVRSGTSAFSLFLSLSFLIWEWDENANFIHLAHIPQLLVIGSFTFYHFCYQRLTTA